MIEDILAFPTTRLWWVSLPNIPAYVFVWMYSFPLTWTSESRLLHGWPLFDYLWNCQTDFLSVYVILYSNNVLNNVWGSPLLILGNKCLSFSFGRLKFSVSLAFSWWILMPGNVLLDIHHLVKHLFKSFAHLKKLSFFRVLGSLNFHLSIIVHYLRTHFSLDSWNYFKFL